TVHDALMHSYRPDVSEATCVEVFRSGYRHAGRVLRPAQVTVAEPPPDSAAPEADGAAAVSADAVDGSSESVPDYPPDWASGSAVPDDTGSIPRTSGGDDSVSAE
nr:nucleotide exchange factor GrpE [Micromonospora sp. DSM 115978]